MIDEADRNGDGQVDFEEFFRCAERGGAGLQGVLLIGCCRRGAAVLLVSTQAARPWERLHASHVYGCRPHPSSPGCRIMKKTSLF